MKYEEYITYIETRNSKNLLLFALAVIIAINSRDHKVEGDSRHASHIYNMCGRHGDYGV